MAAAEARAVWQRAANRCFVQEDAKRAPKLACSQSSSSTGKPVDAEPATEASRPDHPVAGFKPFNRTPSYPNLPPDARWRVPPQPLYGHQKGLTHEQLNTLETEVEMLRAGLLNSISRFSKDDAQKKEVINVDDCNTVEFSAEICHMVSNVGVGKNNEVGKQGVKGVYNTNTEEHESIDVEDSYEKLEMDSLSCSESKKGSEFGLDPVSPWIGDEKTDPWWRVTDRNDLASFVAQKSLDHVENCDLPPPQKMHDRRNLYSGFQGLNSDEIVASSSDWMVKKCVVSNKTSNQQGSHHSGRTQGGHWNSVQVHAQDVPAKPFRTANSRNSSIPTQINRAETKRFETDPSKAELLEALRHSQTRAREAEKAAQRAYAEKEDIAGLFFRQASQLFAYKQWLQMLQLETLYLQLKNNEKPISCLFPVGKKMRKSRQKGKQGKQNQPRHNIGNYLVALALGLGLVGAGLLLGWTMGWLLPF